MTAAPDMKPSEALRKARELNEGFFPADEEWRQAFGLEGRFEVSSYGRMRSLERKVRIGGTSRIDGSPAYRMQKAYLCNHRIDSRGYVCVSTGEGNAVVHRVVCATFNGPPPSLDAICRHLDDNKYNLLPSNLAWGTHRQNAHDALKNGVFPIGSSHYAARISADQVMEIRTGLKTDEEYAEIFGLSRGHVYNIRRMRKWKSIPALAEAEGR